MCGITGKYLFHSGSDVSQESIRDMCSTIKHRGPDDQGIFVDKNFGFGMTRLSVIDLEGGHQPIFNEDGTIAIIFNGEIYNFKQIREQLQKVGHIFKTNSDTETIVHAYEEYGTKCLDLFNGMFAIAIWNSKEQELFLARDRLGVKPLYYYLDSESIVFGSELKPILKDKRVRKMISPEGLNLYLSYFYIPAPFSIFENIYKLCPGNYLLCKKGKTTVTKYWDVEFIPNVNKREDDFIEEFNELLEDSVKLRLLSEVPLGIFLSGGVDSSAIVAKASKISSVPIKTFSIGFEKGTYYDESTFAEEVARIFGTEHTTFRVGSEILGMLPKFSHHFDEPFADYAAFPMFVLSELTRKEVTVTLTGDGGDEIFGGYRRYLTESFINTYRRIPATLRTYVTDPLIRTGEHLTPLNTRLRKYFESASRLSTLTDLTMEKRYIRSLFKFYPLNNSELLTPQYRMNDTFPELVFLNYLEGKEHYDALSKRLYLDIKTSLPEDMLTKVDRTTMAHSLEARVPFLDYRMVEFAATIPSELKTQSLNLKRFVKKALEKELPRHILFREKHGFTTPIDEWLRNDMKQLVHSLLSEEEIKSSGILDCSNVQRYITMHMNGSKNYGVQIFMLLALQMWYREHFLVNP